VASVGYSASLAHHSIVQSNAYVSAVAQGIPLNPLANEVDYYGNYGAANYNALLLDLKHTMSHHFQVDAQFQYAKSLDNASTPYYEDPYPFNSSIAYGPSDYNVGKAFKIYGVWQPVIFPGTLSSAPDRTFTTPAADTPPFAPQPI